MGYTNVFCFRENNSHSAFGAFCAHTMSFQYYWGIIFIVHAHWCHLDRLFLGTVWSCAISTAVRFSIHYIDVTMGTMASQITSLAIVYSTVYYSGADQRKHQSSASLAFVWGIHRGPVNSPHKGPVTRKMFPFDDVILSLILTHRDRNKIVTM